MFSVGRSVAFWNFYDNISFIIIIIVFMNRIRLGWLVVCLGWAGCMEVSCNEDE